MCVTCGSSARHPGQKNQAKCSMRQSRSNHGLEVMTYSRFESGMVVIASAIAALILMSPAEDSTFAWSAMICTRVRKFGPRTATGKEVCTTRAWMKPSLLRMSWQRPSSLHSLANALMPESYRKKGALTCQYAQAMKPLRKRLLALENLKTFVQVIDH